MPAPEVRLSLGRPPSTVSMDGKAVPWKEGAASIHLVVKSSSTSRISPETALGMRFMTSRLAAPEAPALSLAATSAGTSATRATNSLLELPLEAILKEALLPRACSTLRCVSAEDLARMVMMSFLVGCSAAAAWPPKDTRVKRAARAVTMIFMVLSPFPGCVTSLLMP